MRGRRAAGIAHRIRGSAGSRIAGCTEAITGRCGKGTGGKRQEQAKESEASASLSLFLDEDRCVVGIVLSYLIRKNKDAVPRGLAGGAPMVAATSESHLAPMAVNAREFL